MPALTSKSDILFNKLQSSRDLMIKDFSVKHNVQLLGETLQLTFLTILHLSMGLIR